MTDYKNTYIRIQNQEEHTKAVEFYKNKGYNFVNNLGQRDNYNIPPFYYTLIGKDSAESDIIIWLSENTCKNRIDITQEVLGTVSEKQIHIPENTAVRLTSIEEFNLLMEAYDKIGWKWRGGEKATDNENIFFRPGRCIDFMDRFRIGDEPEHFQSEISFKEAMEILGEDVHTKQQTINKNPFGIGVYELTNISQQAVDKFFNLSQPTKMTLIDEKLFERFLKSKETKVLDAVEEAEKNIENYNDSIESINTFFADYHKAKISLEIAYNSKDKSEINRQLKRLHEKEDILKDTLFTEQFFPVIESINKLLRKEIKIVK